jgi:AraC family transcriptional regulator
MDWVIRMNEAVAVIEAGLTGQINYERAARAACCSPWHFQRMFAYLAGIPLSEAIAEVNLLLLAARQSFSSPAVRPSDSRPGARPAA